MCGVAGFIDRRAATAAAALESTARAMAGTLRLRGPDDSGTWTDEAAGIALGHRRLSIVDLSAAGHQPMVSANGRFVIAYNGEIYNARALGRDLERGGPVLRGHSDTEVLVECIARDGLDSVLPKLIGMFAFALWDRETRTLSLVRDRIGIKPMYWGWCGETFLFGSELKALRAHPEFRATVERDSLLSLLRHNYIRGPHSIYEGIYKLMPGHVLSFASGGEPEIAPYWTLDP
ncbi:MAG TPA: asparagine synthetase B, partial [Alphaproteobacteria bacterium]|nr:asparagine synthetase B [Alphaproteobacteria bacterium]